MTTSSSAESISVEAAVLPEPAALSYVTFNRTPDWTEYAGVAGFFALLIALSVKVVEAIRLGSWVWVAVSAVGGFIAADFISGLVHWLFDTWGSPQTPVVGQTFIFKFRVHHEDPQDITRHGFIATNGHNCLATIPVLFGALFLDMHSGWSAGMLAFLMAVSLGTFGTNQFHKWAHQDEVGPVVGFLQRHHVVLNPKHHDRHHTRPYDQAYCITTGWMNPLLRAVRFFRGVEWVITKVTGHEPRKNDLTTA
jgi:plasmanylethanolamine desaturase